MPGTAVETGSSVRRLLARAREVDRRVGAAVRERRTALGLTQHQLAGLAGVTWQQLHKYENGVDRLYAGRLHALARALGTGPGDLFQGLAAEPALRLPRRMLELAHNFAVLPRRQQEVLVELARALAGVGAGGEPAA
jgi:transcriptional regulator with XRE-family HTH domain